MSLFYALMRVTWLMFVVEERLLEVWGKENGGSGPKRLKRGTSVGPEHCVSGMVGT